MSVVTSADGTVVNVALARGGFADDRYLAAHRHENPRLAGALDPAFAAARRDRAGLWDACRSARATAVQAESAEPLAGRPATPAR